MRTHLWTTFVTALVLFAAEGALGQCCGDCNGDGAVAINELITAVNRSLASCQDDGVCDASVATCAAQLGECQGDLADCREQSGCRAFPASGQTTSYGPGSDGAVGAGAPLAYTDNGDGTITDSNTGLTWEKKDRAGGIHDSNDVYTWGMATEPYTMNGTMVTAFLATLNRGPCFAGHCDWRIPNVKELQSIVDYENRNPAVGAAFDTNCTPGCSVNGIGGPACSCTALGNYWSSSTHRALPYYAWDVNFYTGSVTTQGTKNSYYFVRAVRGGM